MLSLQTVSPLWPPLSGLGGFLRVRNIAVGSKPTTVKCLGYAELIYAVSYLIVLITMNTEGYYPLSFFVKKLREVG